MFKNTRQEFCIKTCPLEDIQGLENILNSMSKQGWDLYSLHEGEVENKVVYNVIFVKEVEFSKSESEFEDIQGYKTKMEKMLYSKEEPYELCLNFQKKIREKREKIEDLKHFLEGAKADEREVLNEEIAKEVNELNNLKKQLKSLLSPSKMANALGEERLSIHLSEEIYSLNNPSKAGTNLLAETVKVRQELTNEVGYIIPKVLFLENPELDEYTFTINIHSIPIIQAQAYPEHVVYFCDELNLKKYPKGTIKGIDPLSGRKIVWIPEADAKDFWAEGMNPSAYIAQYLKYFAIKCVSEIFNYNDLNRYIEIVSENNALLIDNILGDFISLSELKYLFCSLIREKVSVKDVIYIFEKINDYADDQSKADLLDKLRVSLSRQICWALSNDDKEIIGYEVNDKVIEMLEAQSEGGDNETGIVKIDGMKFEKFTQTIEEISSKKDIVLVAPQHLRHMLFVLVSELYTDIPVICLEEVTPEFELKILGSI